jgi:hypothetical protein
MELGVMNIGRRGVMKRVVKWLGKGQRDMGRIRRRMWTVNKNISNVLAEREGKLPACGLAAHIPDFEGFYFHKKLADDKPYHAIKMLNSEEFQKTEQYDQLMSFADSVLKGTHPASYSGYDDLVARIKEWRDAESPTPVEAWEVEKHE